MAAFEESLISDANETSNSQFYNNLGSTKMNRKPNLKREL